MNYTLTMILAPRMISLFINIFNGNSFGLHLIIIVLVAVAWEHNYQNVNFIFTKYCIIRNSFVFDLFCNCFITCHLLKYAYTLSMI